MAVQYVGPYSPAVYKAAGQIQNKQTPAGINASQYAAAKKIASQGVLGAASTQRTSGGSGTQQVQQAQQAQVNNNGGDGGNNGGGGEPDWGSMISEMYDPYKRELDEMEGRVQGEYAGDEKILNDQYNLNEKLTNDNQTELIGQTDREEGKYNRVMDSAYEQAIRDYNALNQQSNARFGGGSSAGRAVGELAQKEYFREQGKVNEKRAEGTEEFGLERVRIKKYVADKIEQLKIQRQAAVGELKKQLTVRLDDIKARKYDIEANKTRDKMAALQDTINQARAMRDQDKQFRQGLGLAAISKMQEIQGRAFTPAEIKATMAEFGINLDMGPSTAQQGGGTVYNRAASKKTDQFGNLVDPNVA